MPMTTVKVTTDTRDRLKAMSRGTADDTINAALDALDRAEFWAQAERATAAIRALPDAEQRRRRDAEAALDGAFDGIG